jgi:hypothetical protein
LKAPEVLAGGEGAREGRLSADMHESDLAVPATVAEPTIEHLISEQHWMVSRSVLGQYLLLMSLYGLISCPLLVSVR